MDVNAPPAADDRLRIRSEHFSEEDDLQPAPNRLDEHLVKRTAVPNREACPCTQSKRRKQREMFSGAAKSTSDKRPAITLKSQVKIVLHRVRPPASGLHPVSPAVQPEDNCAETDEPSCEHRSTSLKPCGVDRGVQVNLLCAESCAETTDKSTPQYIVDEEAILQLMKTCPLCGKQCRCSKYTRGPYFIVHQSCYFCDYRRKWASQPEARNMNIRKTCTLPKTRRL